MAGFPNALKDSVSHLFALVGGLVCLMVLAIMAPALAQSKTLTLEEICQKLKKLEAYQKKLHSLLPTQFSDSEAIKLTPARQRKSREATNFLDFLSSRGMSHMIEVPSQLQIKPKLSFHPQKPFEPEGRIRRETALAMNHFVHTRIRDSNLFS
jgi:hypothetical protein